MVKHLIEVYELDVNAWDMPEGQSAGDRGFTPLSYAVMDGARRSIVSCLVTRLTYVNSSISGRIENYSGIC